MKPEYGPSLARLLAPRWRIASRRARAATLLATALVVLVALAAGLTLENATYAHGGSVPFSFEYRGLYRVAPERGGFVKVQSRYADGALKYSYAVDPLTLPPYTGILQSEIPLYATGFIRALAQRYPEFALRGEGKAKVNNTLIGYQVAFTADIEGHEMWGRDVLLMPPQPHPRAGVVVAMLSAPDADEAVLTPLEVGGSGTLLRPLKSFSFG